jgi:hypothetical protein
MAAGDATRTTGIAHMSLQDARATRWLIMCQPRAGHDFIVAVSSTGAFSRFLVGAA